MPSLRLMAVPRATQFSGSGAMATSVCSSPAIYPASPRSSEPPPVSKMPVPDTSAASSGGVLSSTLRAALAMRAASSCTGSYRSRV